MLVGMIDPAADAIELAAILTHPIAVDPKHPTLKGVDSLVARVILAQPQMLDQVKSSQSPEALVVRGKPFQSSGDAASFDFSLLPPLLSACRNIGEAGEGQRLYKSLLATANYVIGVAESGGLPAIFCPLIDVPDRLLPVAPVTLGDSGYSVWAPARATVGRPSSWPVRRCRNRRHESFELCAAELTSFIQTRPPGGSAPSLCGARPGRKE